MALPPEVQASIINVAGEWALTVTTREYEVTSNPDEFYFPSALVQNFEKAYQALIDAVQE